MDFGLLCITLACFLLGAYLVGLIEVSVKKMYLQSGLPRWEVVTRFFEGQRWLITFGPLHKQP